jgi:DNA (cytosine-5)-methyltransferase 1
MLFLTGSLVGEQKGTDGDFGGLYTYCVSAVKKFKPLWFVAENVGGLKSSNDGKAFSTILNEFRNAGYVLTPHLYKFEEYGVPQARHRIIIVGIREDLGFKFAVPCKSLYKDVDNTSFNAIENPPILIDAYNHEIPIHKGDVVERLKYIKPGENAFNANLPEELKLNVKGAKISQIYKRLHPEKPSYTVTGSGGGGTHVYHWSENRALTNRERARLQTFPDNFLFLGSKGSVRKQIGMAVPPKGAKIIFEAILKTFAGVEYKSITENINI